MFIFHNMVNVIRQYLHVMLDEAKLKELQVFYHILGRSVKFQPHIADILNKFLTNFTFSWIYLLPYSNSE